MHCKVSTRWSFATSPILVASAFALGTLSSTVVAASNTADETVSVIIGHAGPVTGQIAHLGKDSENAARMAIEEINLQHPTVGGKAVTFVLDAQDDAADPRTGTQVAQKLVDDGAVAVVGDINSGVSIPASKIYSEADVVQISPASTNPTYTQQGYKTTYRDVATDARQGPALATYVTRMLHGKRIAIVDDATAYGQGLADQFEKSVKAQGATVVAREATNDKAIEFRAIITKIKGLNADVIMYGGSDATAGPFVRQAASLGLKARIVGGDGACTDKMSELAGEAIVNVVCSEAGLAISKMPRGQEFQSKYETRFKTPVQEYGPFSYDAVYIIYQAIKRADSLDRKRILAAMPMTDYDGIIGHIAFDDKGDLKNAAVTIYEFPGKVKTVKDVIKM